MCGKPQPKISWMIGDESFNETVQLINEEQHQYKYSFKKKISSKMCGKNIFYQATGFQGRNVNGTSLILIKDCKFNLIEKIIFSHW